MKNNYTCALLLQCFFISTLFIGCEKDLPQDQKPAEETVYEKAEREIEHDGLKLKSTSSEKLLRHFILFKFNDNTPFYKKYDFVTHLKALEDSISEIQELEWGTNVKHRFNTNDYSHCFMVTFNSLEDFVTYANHPAHLGFYVDWIVPLINDLVVFDYWAEEVETGYDFRYKCYPLRHVALFDFKNNISESDKAYTVESFINLAGKIPAIKKFEWGNEAGLAGLNKEFEVAFTLTFDHYSNYFRYFYARDHMDFVNNIALPNTDEILVADYFIRN